jgi:hypothetical protein
MGALIVLLVIVARQAQAQAQAEQLTAAADKSRQDDERRALLHAQQQSFDHYAKELHAQAGAVTAALTAKQRTAARLQAELDAARRSLQQLADQERDLRQLASQRPSDAELRRQLADLDERLRQAQAILTDRQRAAAQPQELYSIVPYAGRNGEARRPLYIECRGDRIILQPEGTELSAADFEILGPGNPLEAAVRVTIAHWERAGQVEGNPYPLLLVRPDGVQAYHAAREALNTWGREFGYELVEQDWQLAYPPLDPVLAQMQQTAVIAGRQQMEVLAKNQTRRKRSSPSFRVSSSGSLERVGRGGDDDGFSGAPGGSHGRGLGDHPSGSPRSKQGGDGFGDGGGSHGDGTASVFAQRGSGASDPLGVGSNFAGPRGSPLGRSGQDRSHSASAGSFDRPQGDAGPSGRQAPRNDFGHVGTQLDRARGADARSGEGGGERGGAERGTPGGQSSQAASQKGPGASGAAFGSPQMTAGGSPGMAVGSATGTSSPDAGEEAGGAASFATDMPVAPVARKQGTNWALPSKPGRAAAPLRRDVHILVDEGAITVFVDPRTAQTLQVIRLGPDPDITVGELKDAVWTIMKEWGNAPAGFYWRPVLRTQVTFRGAARFAQLDTLLQDSGFEMAAAR